MEWDLSVELKRKNNKKNWNILINSLFLIIELFEIY